MHCLSDRFILKIIVTGIVIVIVDCGVSPTNNLSINIDDEVRELYFDGVRIDPLSLPYAKVWDVCDTVPLPPGTQVIAVYGVDSGGSASLTASDSEGRVFTDRRWKYSKVNESGWMAVDFDDSHWKRVTMIGLNDGSIAPWNHIRGVSRDAGVIWAPGWDDMTTPVRDFLIYFRYRILKNTFRRNFDLIRTNQEVIGASDRCSQCNRNRCAAKCGQMTLVLCAGFQYNDALDTCCLLNATTLQAQNSYTNSPGWNIYSAIVLTDTCC